MCSSYRPGRLRHAYRLAVAGFLVCYTATAPAAVSSHVQISPNNSQTFEHFAGVGSADFQAAAGELSAPGAFGQGSAAAGAGSISAFAVASAQRLSTVEVGTMTVVATASLSDTFTVQTESALPVVLEFSVGAAGSVATVHDGSIAGAIAQAEVNWSISVVGNGQDLATSGRVSENWVRRPPNYNPRIKETIESGLSFTDFTIAVSVPGGVGSMFSVNMATSVAALAVGGADGVQYSALADFGNSLHWFGLLDARFEDGTPYTGAVLLTSESGFDYAQAVAPVPLPGVLAVFVPALALLAAQARRKRRYASRRGRWFGTARSA